MKRRLIVLTGCSAIVSLLVISSAKTLGVHAALPAGVRVLIGGAFAVAAVPALLVVALTANRFRRRRSRVIGRYRVELSQADEAEFEDVAAAYEQLVQMLRVPRLRRLLSGQPWLALEAWFASGAVPGETGSATLALVCEPHVRDAALAALRHAYPDLCLAAEFPRAAAFYPAHVIRVRKARSWAIPIGSDVLQRVGSNQRSTMAAVIRQQQQAGRLSCVRWCIVPAPERQDSRATEMLERVGGDRPGAALISDVALASRAAGGAMAFLELQAAVANRAGAKTRESFIRRQAACRELVAPALSQRGANHLRERLMVIRQSLYRRRWRRAEPPLIPNRGLTTLVSPRELASVMALPSLGSEHALPLQRNTVPHLPIPVEVPRARIVALPGPDDDAVPPIELDAALSTRERGQQPERPPSPALGAAAR